MEKENLQLKERLVNRKFIMKKVCLKMCKGKVKSQVWITESINNFFITDKFIKTRKNNRLRSKEFKKREILFMRTF